MPFFTHILAATIDPREWFDWAFQRGIPGVLALIGIVFGVAIIRLYRENAKLHREKSELQTAHMQFIVTHERDAHAREGKLDETFRDEQRTLLKEQVKLAGANGRVLTETRAALDNASSALERNSDLLQHFVDEERGKSSDESAKESTQP